MESFSIMLLLLTQRMILSLVSTKTARQNHKMAKVLVLILFNLFFLIDYLNPSNTLLLCCCIFANLHLLEKLCSGQFAHFVRVCSALDVTTLRFKLCDYEEVKGDNKKKLFIQDPSFISFSQSQIARSMIN